MTLEVSGNYLRAHRRRCGLSQRQLGILVGYTHRHAVGRHERSSAVPPLLVALAYEDRPRDSDCQALHRISLRGCRVRRPKPEFPKNTMPAEATNRIAKSRPRRVVALEIRPRRLAFAVLQGDNILEWGTRRFPSGSVGHEMAVRKLAFLLKIYPPSYVTARRTRVRHESSESAARVLTSIRRELNRRRIRFMVVARDNIREFFNARGCRTKQQIATYIVDRFPPLRPILPRPRKKWEPEWRILAVFDAIATAIMAITTEAG